MLKTTANILLFSASFVLPAIAQAPFSPRPNDDPRHTLWYESPGEYADGRGFKNSGAPWTSGLPMGNGELAAMAFGGTDLSPTLYNIDSLWTGWNVTDIQDRDSYDALEKVRKIIRNGGIEDKAMRKMLKEEVFSPHGYKSKSFGSYQRLAVSQMHFGHKFGDCKDYRRELDLKSATHHLSYKHAGVTYKRTSFASHPSKSIFTHITADQPGKISFSLSIVPGHEGDILKAEGKSLTLTGQIDNGKGNPKGIRYAARWLVSADGGSVTPSKDGKKLLIKNANSVTIRFSAATNHQLKFSNYLTAEDPLKLTQTKLDLHSDLDLNAIYQKHLKDHSALYERCELTLGNPEFKKRDINTIRRKKTYKGDDPDYAALVFHYGRYLLIAGSRSGHLPNNLQGIWNNNNNPPWLSDYHLDINLQMNYWPAATTNLPETEKPLVKYVEELAKAGERTAKVLYRAPGWVCHIASNIFGSTSSGSQRGSMMSENASSAFLCQTIYRHWSYQPNSKVLKRIYPVHKKNCLFWLHVLEENKDGRLVVNPSISPEHGPVGMVAFYQPIVVWSLFTNTLHLASVHGEKDQAFLDKIKTARKKLIAPTIGQHGQIMEWNDPEVENTINGGVLKSKHRHVNHLYALFPSQQITAQDEKLFKAAKRSLNLRGDGGTGWAMGWKLNLWAHLQDGDRAHKILKNFIGKNFRDNLWAITTGAFQIEANFGCTSGISEMLVQSHWGLERNSLHILPALPQAWPEGNYRGAKIRGGHTIDLSWKNSKLTKATIRKGSAELPETIYLQGKKISREDPRLTIVR